MMDPSCLLVLHHHDDDPAAPAEVSPSGEALHSHQRGHQGISMVQSSHSQLPTQPSRLVGEPSGGGGNGGVDPDHPAAHQAPILLLLRTLCQASQLSAQLIRSSGVFPLVQAHLLMGCRSINRDSADPGGASGLPARGEPNGAFIQSQLCVVEALRVWRVCCHQGVSGLSSLEDVFTSICRLMLPPVTAQPGTSSHLRGHHQALSAALSWHVSREANLLVSSLMLHAVQCVEKLDKSLGRPLIQPGTAAAVAQEALQWIHPQSIRMVSETLVEMAGGWQGDIKQAGSR